MKMLDEVIEMAERCTLPYPGDCLNCEYFDEDDNDCRCKILADALYYLKEYRKKGYSWLKEEMRLRRAIDGLLVSLETVKCILHGDDE